MNIQNISALVKQLQLLGLEELGYPLLKRISFKPNSFHISQKIERFKDVINLQLFFEKRSSEDIYDLVYYDAILQQEMNLSDSIINGINLISLEKQMGSIDWKKAFELEEKKTWNSDDKTSWEKEQKIEAIISDLCTLEASEEGKAFSVSLKLKYWKGTSYHELFESINIPKSKAEVFQRFYFVEGQASISIDEAYRFLQNRRTEKLLLAKRKQIENPQDGLEENGSNSSGSDLLKKRRLNGGKKGQEK